METTAVGGSPPKKIEQGNTGFTLSYQEGKWNFSSGITIEKLLLHLYLLQNLGPEEVVTNMQKFL